MTTKSWLILAATEQEIGLFLEKTSGKEEKAHKNLFVVPATTMYPGGYVYITGVGPYAAHIGTKSVIEYLQDRCPKSWLNIGLCGDAKKEPNPIGSWVTPEEIYLISWVPPNRFEIASFSDSIGEKKKCTLYTAPIPIYQKLDHLKIDYVDMEAYPIYRLAQEYQMQCQIEKIVSDHCQENSGQKIKEHLVQLREQIADRAFLWISHHNQQKSL